MQYLVGGINYLVRNFLHSSTTPIDQLILQHLWMTVLSLGIALLIALPLGVLLSHIAWLRVPVLNILGIIYTIPSLALLVILLPFFGLGLTPAVIALVGYAQLVLVRNTVVGLTGVDPAVIEAARGMGMNGWQRFWRLEFPLALPLILAGTRLAAIAIVGIGTVAAYINAGGVGLLLFIGVESGNKSQIVAGGIAICGLAIALNGLLHLVERRVTLAI